MTSWDKNVQKRSDRLLACGNAEERKDSMIFDDCGLGYADVEGSSLTYAICLGALLPSPSLLTFFLLSSHL
jgi:hypothetical protein